MVKRQLMLSQSVEKPDVVLVSAVDSEDGIDYCMMRLDDVPTVFGIEAFKKLACGPLNIVTVTMTVDFYRKEA